MVNYAPTKTATILVLGSAGLGYLDTSALYHVIRGQSVGEEVIGIGNHSIANHS